MDQAKVIFEIGCEVAGYVELYELTGNHLRCSQDRWGDRALEARLGAAEVAELWNEFDAAGAWSWNASYFAFMLDGYSWRLEASSGERGTSSSGSNGYPPHFDRLCRAFRALRRKLAPTFGDGVLEDPECWLSVGFDPSQLASER